MRQKLGSILALQLGNANQKYPDREQRATRTEFREGEPTGILIFQQSKNDLGDVQARSEYYCGLDTQGGHSLSTKEPAEQFCSRYTCNHSFFTTVLQLNNALSSAQPTCMECF